MGHRPHRVALRSHSPLTHHKKGARMHIMHTLKESGQVPNTLTWTRVALFWVPAAFIFASTNNTAMRWWSLLAFLVIVATDKLDGALARRWNQVSQLGQIIDPLADKLLVVTLVVALCATDILASPWGWLFLGFNVIRELGVSLVRYLKNRGEATLVVPANNDGKVKMFLQSTGIALAMVPVMTEWWQFIVWIPLIASLFYSVRSGIAYLKAR